MTPPSLKLSYAEILEPAILYQDSAMTVLNKPARWHSVDLRGEGEPSVEAWIRSSGDVVRSQILPEAGLVHRLDYLTTGCLLSAGNEELQLQLQEAIRSAQVKKTYLAIVRPGLKASGSFELAFEGRYRRSKKVTVSRTGDSALKGRCQWRTRGEWIAPDGQSQWDLLEIELLGPGRRHQIRAGFSFLGADLYGDPLYGLGSELGLGLHAWRIELPASLGLAPQTLRVEAPLPKWWASE